MTPRVYKVLTNCSTLPKVFLSPLNSLTTFSSSPVGASSYRLHKCLLLSTFILHSIILLQILSNDIFRVASVISILNLLLAGIRVTTFCSSFFSCFWLCWPPFTVKNYYSKPCISIFTLLSSIFSK